LLAVLGLFHQPFTYTFAGSCGAASRQTARNVLGTIVIGIENEVDSSIMKSPVLAQSGTSCRSPGFDTVAVSLSLGLLACPFFCASAVVTLIANAVESLVESWREGKPAASGIYSADVKVLCKVLGGRHIPGSIDDVCVAAARSASASSALATLMTWSW
jgi:hypothetical protein